MIFDKLSLKVLTNTAGIKSILSIEKNEHYISISVRRVTSSGFLNNIMWNSKLLLRTIVFFNNYYSLFSMETLEQKKKY